MQARNQVSLFFHLIPGQREQDPPGAFIIVLKGIRRDLNLNPKDPNQERTAPVASRPWGTKADLQASSDASVHPVRQLVHTTCHAFTIQPCSSFFPAQHLGPSPPNLLPPDTSPVFYLTKLFCPSFVKDTNTPLTANTIDKTGYCWL